MSFILTRLNQPNDIVDIHYVPLLNKDIQHLIIARKHSVDIAVLNDDGKIVVRRSIPILDTILDVSPLEPIELDGTWLALTTDSSKVLIVAFRGSIEKDVVVEEYTDSELGQILSLEKNTLRVDQGKFMSVYTTEGCICFFELHRSKDLKNFAKALDPSIRSKQTLFKKPQILTMSNMQGRTPLTIEAIEPHYEEGVEMTLSVLYRDDLYNYFTSYFTLHNKQFEQRYRLKFTEEMTPLILPLNRNQGNIFFGRSGIYIRSYPGMTTSIKAHPSLLNSKDGATIETVEKDGKVNFIKRTTPHPWKVTSATLLHDNALATTHQILFTTAQGHLYITRLETEVTQDSFGYPDQLQIKAWTLKRFPAKFFALKKITQVSNTSFVGFSNTAGILSFSVDLEKMKFTVPHTKECTPPILDFNITGSTIPKLQMMGGTSLTDGLLRTEFKGFETERDELASVDVDDGVTGLWKFGDVFVVNHLDGIEVFEVVQGQVKPLQDFHRLKNVDGSLHDLKMSFGELIAVTETGVFHDGVKVDSKEVRMGVVAASGNAVTISGATLAYKNQTYNLTEEVSALSVLEVGSKTHILIGTWSGETALFSQGSKRLLHKSTLSVHSTLVKQIGGHTVYVSGGGGGSVVIINGEESMEYSIGSAPVSLLDFDDTSVLVANRENILRFVFDTKGDIIHKGYLDVDFPDAMTMDNDDLITLHRKKLQQHRISDTLETLQNDIRLPRMIRKSTSFKNYLNLSLIVTVTEKYNSTIGRDMMTSQLEVVDNNTFHTRSIYKFNEGIEVTDVVNTTYRKTIIDTYEEEKVSMGFENVLAQCFVVSCAYHMQDEVGTPLMLFSVDEHGVIQHECSAEKSKMSFYSLVNHANRLVVGAGNAVCAYRIEYSMADSKLSLKRVSEQYRSRFYASVVKSVGPDLVVGDVVKGPVRLKLKVKENVEEGEPIFRFVERKEELDPVHFLTVMETFENLIVCADSLRNVVVFLANKEGGTHPVMQFNIGDQINVVKKIDREVKLGEDTITRVFMDGLEPGVDVADVVPMFILGSVGGGMYLISLVTKQEVIKVLDDAQVDILSSGKLRVLAKEQSGEAVLTQFADWKKYKTANRGSKPVLNYIDGDLIKKYDEDIAKDIVEMSCKLI